MQAMKTDMAVVEIQGLANNWFDVALLRDLFVDDAHATPAQYMRVHGCLWGAKY